MLLRPTGDDQALPESGATAKSKQKPARPVIPASPEAQQRYVADINRAQQLLARRDAAGLRTLLESHRPQPGHEDLRGFEWHHLRWWCQGDRIKSFADPTPPTRPVAPKPPTPSAAGYIQGVVSPDGKWVAAVNTDAAIKTITLWDAATGKELRTLAGHGWGDVYCLAFNPDGSRLASGGQDGTVRIWDTAGGKDLFTFRGHGLGVVAVAFFPDGRRIASADNGGRQGNRARDVARVKVWELPSGQEKLTFATGNSVNYSNLAVGADGKYLLLFPRYARGSVSVHDAGSGRELLHVMGGGAEVSFDRDGKLLQNWGKLWDVARLDPKEKHPYLIEPTHRLHYEDVRSSKDAARGDKQEPAEIPLSLGRDDSATFAPDGKTLVVGTGGWWGRTELTLWDPATGKPKGNYERFARKVRYSTKKVKVEAVARNILARFPGSVEATAFTPDGKSLVTVSSQSRSSMQVRIWDLATGKARTNKSFPVFFNPLGERLRSVVVGPDERSLVLVFDVLNLGGGYQTLSYCDLATGAIRRLAKQPPAPARPPAPPRKPGPGTLAALQDRRPRPEVWSLALAPNGGLLATASAGHLIRLWGASEQPALTGHKGDVRHLAWTPDSKVLASASADGTVKLWDPAVARELVSVAAHKGGARCVAFAPRGKLLASGGADRTVRVWEYGRQGKTLKLRATLAGHLSEVWALAFSPNGKTLAAASGTWETGQVKVWDTATWKEPVILSEATAVHAVAFAPDGKLLVTGDHEGNVSLWDTATWKKQAILDENASGRDYAFHGDAILSLAFSGDGQWLASASADGLVKVWDVKQKACYAWYSWHQGAVRGLAFMGSSRPFQLLSGGQDGQVILGRLRDGTPLQLAFVKLEDRVRPLARLQSGSLQVLTRALSPNGKLLATGDLDGTVLLWDPATGTRRRTLRGHRGQVAALAFSQGGDLLASLATPLGQLTMSSQNGITWLAVADQLWQIKVWDTATGKERGHLQWQADKTAPVAVAVSSDGRWGAAATAGSNPQQHLLVFWDVAGKKSQFLPAGPAPATALAFAPDARVLAVAAANGEVRLWDVASKKQKSGIVFSPDGKGPAHAGAVGRIVFSPDGKTLATTGKDRALRLWHVTTGKLLLVFADLPQEAGSLTFRPDGTALTAVLGNEVRTWPAAPKRNEGK